MREINMGKEGIFSCHVAPYRFWKQATKRHRLNRCLEEAQVFLMLKSEKISSVDLL